MSHTLPAVTWDTCQVWESHAAGGETEPAQSSAWGGCGIPLLWAITMSPGDPALQHALVTFCCRQWGCHGPLWPHELGRGVLRALGQAWSWWHQPRAPRHGASPTVEPQPGTSQLPVPPLRRARPGGSVLFTGVIFSWMVPGCLDQPRTRTARAPAAGRVLHRQRGLFPGVCLFPETLIPTKPQLEGPTPHLHLWVLQELCRG